MAYDVPAADRIRKQLAAHAGLVERKMMGGICFMLDGHMTCGVTGDSLLVRVGREDYEASLARPHTKPLEFGGRRPTGFILVEPAGYRTEKALATWIERARRFVATLPASAKSPAKRSKRKP